MLAARDRRERLLAQFLVYPALDPDCASDAYEQYEAGTTLAASDMRFFWEAYLTGGDAGCARTGRTCRTTRA